MKMFYYYIKNNYVPQKTIKPFFSLNHSFFSIFNLQKAAVLKFFLVFLLFLPNTQNTLFAQSGSLTEYVGPSYGYATGAVAENQMMHLREAFNEPVFIPNETHFYTKFDNVSKYLVVVFWRTIKAGIPGVQYKDIHTNYATTLPLQVNFNGAAYKKYIL